MHTEHAGVCLTWEGGHAVVACAGEWGLQKSQGPYPHSPCYLLLSEESVQKSKACCCSRDEISLDSLGQPSIQNSVSLGKMGEEAHPEGGTEPRARWP